MTEERTAYRYEVFLDGMQDPIQVDAESDGEMRGRFLLFRGGAVVLSVRLANVLLWVRGGPAPPPESEAAPSPSE